MSIQVQAIAVLTTVTLLFVVFELIRKGKLRERFALTWVLGGFTILLLSLFPSPLGIIADWIAIEYDSAILFLIGLWLILDVLLTQTVAISKLNTENRDLAQRVAISEWSLERLKEILKESRDLPEEIAASVTPVFNIAAGQEEDGNGKGISDRPGRGHLRFIEAVGSESPVTEFQETPE